ncbi:MAG: NAD(P)-dependent oxidoreductase [Verrucomicrobia bacterium]|nr:NAD(P)-dependent oxidoreductase [Verrucomicrobiota bacterium]
MSSKQPNTLLLTGASGFLGRECLPALMCAGFTVHAVSREPQEMADVGVQWHLGDLMDSASIETLIHDVAPTHLVHCAWYVAHGKFWHAKENLQMVQASIELFNAFGRHGGQRAIGIGTCAEYQFGRSRLGELDTPTLPTTVYGSCKAAAGFALMGCAKLYGFSAAWARIFFPYGPGAPPQQFLPSLLKALRHNAMFEMSDGSQIRDFIHVSDIADAICRLARNVDVQGPINLGTGDARTLRSVAEQVRTIMGSSCDIKFGAVERSSDDPDSIVADVGRLRDELSWRNTLSFEQGLHDMITNLA